MQLFPRIPRKTTPEARWEPRTWRIGSFLTALLIRRVHAETEGGRTPMLIYTTDDPDLPSETHKIAPARVPCSTARHRSKQLRVAKSMCRSEQQVLVDLWSIRNIRARDPH